MYCNYKTKKENKMRIDRNMTRGLAQSAMVMNTLGGGMSLPVSKVKKTEDQYLYSLSIPGVDADFLSIEINNNNLLIFQNMDFGGVVIPYMIQRVHIPSDVEFDQISAEYDDGRLLVVMPINELAGGGYHRQVDIEKH
jgi:HSP20 family molecular chaperone IbpA